MYAIIRTFLLIIKAEVNENDDANFEINVTKNNSI